VDKDTRNAIERATQQARRLLEDDFAEQLNGTFDVFVTRRDGQSEVAADGWAEKPGAHLDAKPKLQARREKIVAALEHKHAAGMSREASVADYLRDAAFTTLNRFVALKMLEARELVQECVTRGEQSSGYREFCGLAPGVALLPDAAGYRLYIESLFDELSTEIKVLFDRRDPASVLWPKRATFDQLLGILNAQGLATVWGEDETIGWVYQYFNGSDERRKMREESQAPRNSRELAVRNQFFTPRYVVQFLTDNTLGRIWYEMRDTQTALADRCEYMVRRPGETFAAREKKDPRDLKVLDPACGSGHFLLYAFDLLVTIYEEAHADAESPKSEVTGRTLREDYPAVEALRKALPGLILAHNLHGVDIDARCAQIAQLALWMRAQRAYRDFCVKREDRPFVRRSNIVVAEPLVADESLAGEFVDRLGDRTLGEVFTRLVSELKLAGDMGVLLRIEKLVAPEWEKNRTARLFQLPEKEIRAALERFVSEEGSRVNLRRRLFADDAAQGIGLLETTERKFDVVLMNPPFGDGSTRAKREFDRAYPRTKNDVYAAFVERGIELLTNCGRLGAITSRTGFFLSSFQKWREEILLERAPPVVFADLGLGVMDAALVEAAAYCLEQSERSKRGRTVFLRVLEELDDKVSALKTAIAKPTAPGVHKRFYVDTTSFRSIPGSPFAYWVSDSLRDVYRTTPAFEGDGREARQGLATADDFRFVRLWWEVPGDADKWFPYAKGGKYSPFYFDLHLMVNWQCDGREIVTFCKPGSDRPASVPRNTGYFFRAGLTWPRRTKSELSFRVMPAGCVFGDKGPAAFVNNDNADALLATLAGATSKAFRALIEFQLAAADAKAGGAARSYEVGIIQRTPMVDITLDAHSRLSTLARRAWAAKRALDTMEETSHAFLLPTGLNEQVTGLNSGAIESELQSIQNDIDEALFALYRIDAEDRAAIEASFTRSVSVDCHPEDEDDEERDETKESGVAASVAPYALNSWLVGAVFGRFDPRLATGERAVPEEPEPFDPLPPRSPGMWPEGETPNDIPGILVDDEGHSEDLTARVRWAAERVRWQPPEDVRAWLAREFFSLHIKMYSKSRRKAPIYWQLATPSGSYSVWLYIRAFTKDTLFRVRHDYVGPKLKHEERRLESLRAEFGENPSAAQRKRIAAQESFVQELRVFLEEIERVAPLWNPDLDDGVIINFAPLWRLVPHNKSWQKELKATWDSLCAEEYEWSHLAMHLWPERVVPKCAKDRSLAIAHGLEEVFWMENSEGKWVARETPTRSIEELVHERTSPAVKAALDSLLQAPAARNGRGRSRSRRPHTAGSA
jgi:hypothetical protein